MSPEREAPLRDAFVLLAEGRIRSVSAERPPVDKGVRRVDGRGRFLVPGLIDSHVHVGMPPGVGILTEDFEKRHGDMLAAYWRQAPRSYLYHGVTAAVRADPLAGVEAWNEIETVILHGELIPRESLAVPLSGSATRR